jgi:N-acetylmuramoyl-L-alanine amidase
VRKRNSALALLLAGLLGASNGVEARKRGPQRTEPVNLVVLHSTGGPTCDLKTGRPIWVKAGTMEDNLKHIEAHPTLGIHYMIDRDGTTRTSVPESQIAHHVFRYSERSIAIELINDGDGIDPFPTAQINALVTLVRDIKTRHRITRDGVKRHSDLDKGKMPCAPERPRKVDPGAAFPFEEVLDRVFQKTLP